ncbi:hypothetical protein [Psychrobacter sp. AOP31-A1-22]|uniref:hypothetical protein n=1 Tax=Psychrobacter sp. AOP31-A1-22 TaxID=3457696 RepID=UPI0040354C9E
MNNTNSAVAEMLRNSNNIVDLFSGSKGVSIKSLKVYDPLLPDFHLINPASSIKVPTTLVLDYNGVFELEMELDFSSDDALSSMDITEAIETVKNSNFNCTFDCKDEWEFDDGLHAQVRTKHEVIADWLIKKDSDNEVVFIEKDDCHYVDLILHSAGQVLFNISTQASLSRYSSGYVHTELGKQILAAMREAAVARLEEAVAKVA